jgi:hypothetical protein
MGRGALVTAPPISPGRPEISLSVQTLEQQLVGKHKVHECHIDMVCGRKFVACVRACKQQHAR